MSHFPIRRSFLMGVQTGWILCVACWMSSMVRAENPSVESLHPIAGTRGGEFEMKVTGSGLDKIAEVHFYDTGLKCLGWKAASDEALIIRLEAASDCRIGLHALRIRTSQGFSELRTIVITPSPIVLESERDPSNQVQEVTGDVCVVAQLSGGTTDRFQVALQKGEWFSAEVEAIRLGVALLDTRLRALGPDGRTIDQVDDTHLFRQDPALSFRAEETGDYLIEVQEAGTGQADGSPYLLHLGRRRLPSSVFPMGGQAGTMVDVTIGSGSSDVFQQPFQLPSTPTASYPLQIAIGGTTAPTCLPYRVSNFENAFEVESNDAWDSISASQKVLRVPVAWNGAFQREGDRDCCWLEVKQGQKLDLNVFANRLFSPVDALMTVVDESMRVLARSDDLESLDSHVSIEVAQTGRLGIQLEDKRAKFGPTFAYRLEVSQAEPEIEVFLPRRDRLSQQGQTIDIPRGNRVLAFLGLRKSHEGGKVKLDFPRLPEGVRVFPGEAIPGEYIVPVVFEASAEAAWNGELVPIDARWIDRSSEVRGTFKQVIDLVSGPADAIYRSIETDRIAISVIDPQPFSIHVSPLQTSLAIDGTMDIQIDVQRAIGFQDAIEISIPWLPPFVDAEPSIIIQGDQSSGTVRLRAWKQASAGKWPLVFEALSKSGQGNRSATTMIGADTMMPAARPARVSIASQPFVLEVTPGRVTGEIPELAGEQGESLALKCGIRVPQDFSGDWMAVLEGLPNRVHCEAVPVPLSSQSITFNVQLDQTAPLGTYAGLVCRMIGKWQGQDVSYIFARDGKLTITEPNSIVRDASDRPLTRLEVLRTKQGNAP